LNRGHNHRAGTIALSLSLKIFFCGAGDGTQALGILALLLSYNAVQIGIFNVGIFHILKYSPRVKVFTSFGQLLNQSIFILLYLKNI
jgi:hypothetical protein